MWQTGTSYDPELHARNQLQHGSWVCNSFSKKPVNNFYEKTIYTQRTSVLLLIGHPLKDIQISTETTKRVLLLRCLRFLLNPAWPHSRREEDQCIRLRGRN